VDSIPPLAFIGWSGWDFMVIVVDIELGSIGLETLGDGLDVYVEAITNLPDEISVEVDILGHGVQLVDEFDLWIYQ